MSTEVHISLGAHPFAHREYPKGMLAVWFGRDLRPRSRQFRTLIAGILGALAIHIGVLVLRLHNDIVLGPGAGEHPPIAVRLAPAPKPVQRAEAVSPPVEVPHTRVAPMVSTIHREHPALAVPPPPVVAPPEPIATPPDDDFSARLARRRAERSQQEANETASNAVARGGDGNDRDILIRQNIERSMNPGKEGGGGIFMVNPRDIGVRVAKFTFRGWTPADRRVTAPQTFEVDAGIDGDVRRAIIRRMIELIRARYDGDFQWESQRLGRVITMSARPQDNARLESFLMVEIFSQGNT